MIILLLAFIWAGLPAASGGERLKKQRLPELVTYKIDPKSKIELGKPFDLSALVGSAIGTQTEVKISFDSSPNLKIEAKGKVFPSIQEKDEKEILIKTSWVGEVPKDFDSMNTWVRMTIEYSPDYETLLTFLRNEAKIPDQSERKKLVRQTEDLASQKKKKTVHLRFFPGVSMLLSNEIKEEK